MEKVAKIYMLRRIGAFSLKSAFALASIYLVANFVFVKAIFDNFINVLERGDVLLYVSDALAKAEMPVLLLSAAAIAFFAAALNDARKMAFGPRLSFGG